MPRYEVPPRLKNKSKKKSILERRAQPELSCKSAEFVPTGPIDDISLTSEPWQRCTVPTKSCSVLAPDLRIDVPPLEEFYENDNAFDSDCAFNSEIAQYFETFVQIQQQMFYGKRNDPVPQSFFYFEDYFNFKPPSNFPMYGRTDQWY